MALLKIRTTDGEIVEIAALPGAKGEDGKDGYTPVKGKDYFTPDEQEAFLAVTKAYIDEKTVPASSEKYGTVKVADDEDMASITTGIYLERGTGMLSIIPANKYQIDGRWGICTVITPQNLEYAVKSVGDGYYAKAEDVGSIEAALDLIIAMQETLIGGGAE